MPEMGIADNCRNRVKSTLGMNTVTPRPRDRLMPLWRRVVGMTIAMEYTPVSTYQKDDELWLLPTRSIPELRRPPALL